MELSYQKKLNLFFEGVYSLNKIKNELGHTQDLLTPGYIKEMIMGNILGHVVHKTKHGSDATNHDGTEEYEYLSAKIGGSGQLDRINLDNLNRITRNSKFYFGFFNDDGITCQRIYEVETKYVLKSAKEKINSGLGKAKLESKTWTSNHIGWSEKDVLNKLKGKIFYDKDTA